MAKIIDKTEDLPENLSLEGKTKGAEATNASESREYTPSDYILDRLNKFPKEDIKKVIGLDIDNLIKTTKRYGVLEALAFGDYAGPVYLKTGNLLTQATVRLDVQREDPTKWDCEIHKVSMRYAVDENGNLKVNDAGKYILEHDVNPLKKNDVLFLNGEPLSPEKMDQLRLVGHIEGPALEGTKNNGDPYSVIVSVDRYNNHELCRTTDGVIKSRLLPSVFIKDNAGNVIRAKSLGCSRPEGSGTVMVEFDLSDSKGLPVKNAVNNSSRVRVPVNAPVEIKLLAENGRAESSLSLSSSQIGKLAPSITYETKDKTRVVSYFSAKQVGEMSRGRSVWAGSPEMSYLISGTRDKASISEIKDRSYCVKTYYDVFSAKVTKGIEYEYAKKREIDLAAKKNQTEGEAKAVAESKSMQPGNHV